MKNIFNLKSTMILTALVLGVSGAQVFAGDITDDAGQSAYTKAFKALDTDASGTLTKSEVKKEKLFYQNFSAADKDNDNTLDEQEYTNYKTHAEQKNVKRIASDSVITSKVKGKLLKDEGLKSLKISVETNQGEVILSGFVTTEDQIQQAEKIAAGIKGVKSVKNSLVLKKD